MRVSTEDQAREGFRLLDQNKDQKYIVNLKVLLSKIIVLIRV